MIEHTACTTKIAPYSVYKKMGFLSIGPQVKFWGEHRKETISMECSLVREELTPGYIYKKKNIYKVLCTIKLGNKGCCVCV